MKQSEEARRFLAGLDQESLKVGDGSDGLPVWIGIDAEAGKVYHVCANGFSSGFGNGALKIITGIGPNAEKPIEQTTMGKDIVFQFGEGMDMVMHFMEMKPEFLLPAPEVDLTQVLFELHGPDGHVWTLSADGQCKGFPEGTRMVNYALPVIYGLMGRMKGQDAAARTDSPPDQQEESPVIQSYRALQGVQIKTLSDPATPKPGLDSQQQPGLP